MSTCFFYCFGAGVLGNDRDNSDDDGDGGYDNPVQDHMSDQYSPPDAPLNAPVDPGQQNTTCCICIFTNCHQEFVVLSIQPL